MKRGILLAALPMLVWLAIGSVQVFVGPHVGGVWTHLDRQPQGNSAGHSNVKWSPAGETQSNAGEQTRLNPIRLLDGSENQGGPASRGYSDGANELALDEPKI